MTYKVITLAVSKILLLNLPSASSTGSTLTFSAACRLLVLGGERGRSPSPCLKNERELEEHISCSRIISHKTRITVIQNENISSHIQPSEHVFANGLALPVYIKRVL